MSNGSRRSESILRFGDEIFFYDQNNDILVAESPLETRACVRPTVNHCLSSDNAMGTSIFRIEPQQSHAAQRELELFKGDDRDPDSIACKATAEELEELTSLRAKAAKELSQNEAERRRLLGKPVLYGQVVQLFNQHYRKYLTVTGKTKVTSNTNHHLLQVNLSSDFIGYFRIMPRYRIRFVGDAIRVSETVALQCVRPEGYLNVDYNSANNNENGRFNGNYYEVYSHTSISSWTMKLHYSSISDQDTKNVKYTNSGQYVRFYHKEMESYLEAPATILGNEVVLKKHIINPLDPKESDSPLAFWEIENADISRGSKIRWKKSVRIRHAASRAYLSIDPSNVRIDVATGKTTFTLKLLKNPPCPMDSNQDTTLFQLIPISAPSISGISYGSYVRIQHVLTACWMHASNGEEKEVNSSSSVNNLPYFNVTAPTSARIPVVMPSNATLSPSSSLKTRSLNIPPLSISQTFSESHSRYNSMSTLIDDENENTPSQAESEDGTVQYRITASPELYYHDCFSITLVDEDLSNTFNIANEMLPQLHWYLTQTRYANDDDPYPIHDSEYESIVSILKALNKFCTKSKERDVEKREGLPLEYHQTLLRDIGIIEAVVQIITIPFDLVKRKDVRENLRKSNNNLKQAHKYFKADGKVEKIGSLSQEKLRHILKMCYHLLRVFLIKRSPFEEPNSIAYANKQYVLNTLGEAGVSLFIEHVPEYLGATDVLIKLLRNNDDDEKVTALRSVSFLDTLIEAAVQQVRYVQHLIETESVGDKRKDFNFNCFRLLSALCEDANFSKKIAEKLFNVDNENCVIQMEMGNSVKKIRIKLGNDIWRDFDDLIANPLYLYVIDLLLELAYSLSVDTHTTNVQLTRKCITRHVCLYGMKNKKLPSRIRSRFCDILRAVYVDITEHPPIILSNYTFDIADNPRFVEYPRNILEGPLDFFSKVIRWTLSFFDERQSEYVEDTNGIELLSSVLKLVHTQLKLGFFAQARDIVILFRVLLRVLDGRTDARNPEHLQYITEEKQPREWCERYLLTEENQKVMDTKIQILNIFNLIFDLRLHVRLAYLLCIWIGDGSYDGESNPQWEHFEIPREIIDFSRESLDFVVLLYLFDETELCDRENWLVPILKDILKYQYAPLKQAAVVVMHRVYNDSQEVFKHIPSVVILDNDRTSHFEVYRDVIKKNLELLDCYAYFNISNTEDNSDKQNLSKINQAIAELKLSISDTPLKRNFYYQSHMQHMEIEDLEEPSPGFDKECITQKICRIMRSLKVGDRMVNTLKSLLNIPASHYHDYIDIIENCLDFLCVISRYDKVFQSEFVLQNMDLLINISLLSAKLAHVFSRLCSNNLYISNNIKEEHLIRIISSSEGYQGDYLLVLHDLLKTQGKLVKQNQDIVMRFIMENRSEYIPFNNTELIESIKSMDKESKNYFVNLISILAICGQGENTFGQSFARTIFSIGDIYSVVHDDSVPLSLKAVMLKFLASIYIEDVELPLDIPFNDSHNVFQLMVISEDVMKQCLYEEDHSLPKSFHYYVYRGISAFLRSIFEYHISIENAILDDEKVDFYTRLVDLILRLLPKTFGDEKALQAMLTCLDSMINVAGFRGSMEPEQLRDLLKEATLILDKLYARSHRSESQSSYPSEKLLPIQDRLNIDFQNFFKPIQSNTQLAEYHEIQFKKLSSHFDLNSHGGNDYIQSLISYLDTITTTNVDKRIEHYQVKTIQLLENVVTQFINERMGVNPNIGPALYEELEAKKTMAQNNLNDLGCTLVAQNLLSSPRRKIFDAALKLLIALLEGGNKNVQDKLEEYFYSISEERFFYSFHQRLQSGIISSKDSLIYLTRRTYKMNRQQYMQDNIVLSQEQQQSSRKRKVQQNRRSKSIMAGNKTGASPKVSSKRYSQITSFEKETEPKLSPDEYIKIYQEISQLMVTNSESNSKFGTSIKDFKVMEDTMRTLQLMVEGHNLSLQTYLAKQPDNIKSFNIVLDVVEYFHAIVPLCCSDNIELIIQVLDTVTELAQGCLENQVTIFNNKIINPMNIILRESYEGCRYEDVNELKSKVVICLLSLLEGGLENSETIFKEMIDSLDLATVKNNMNAIYTENLPNLKSKSVYEKLECGFLYCILVMTLTPALEQDQTFLEDNSAFKYFQSHTGQIEIVMNYGQEMQLTRVLFPIPEICQYLRDETKQRFLWNVKRESPSSKIEDFVQQSEMIIYEIENQANVAHNKYLSFLTEYSSFWWESAYGVTVLLNFLLMMYPSLLIRESNPIKILVIATRYLLSLAHLGLWFLLTAEFYFIQLPVLVNRRLQEASTTMDRFIPSFVLQKFKSPAFVWATITESRFLYHILMVIFSIVGMMCNPGFYSIHLLDFVFRDSILQGVISSITLNIHSISRTAILGIIVVYIHSIIAYMYFRKEFDDSKGLFCGSLMECFITVLSHGVRSGGGIGDILEPDELHRPSGWRTVFEMSFYLVVVVFLLNAIFGIIFDTFGHLRDERSSIQQDMTNSCFICSIPAVEFQRRAKKGFENHVKNDHNIWQYLFFLVHLRNKDPTEYTGPESYVAHCLRDADYSFFPINRALGLDKEDDKNERLDKLEELNQSLLEKLVKLEEHIDKLNEQQSRSRQNSFMLSPM